jgi:hypothetical protein
VGVFAIEYAGASAEEVLESTGVDLSGPLRWDRTLTYEICKDASGASVRWRTPSDDVTFRFPRTAGDPVVSVNGLAAAIPEAYARRLGAVVAGGGDPSATETPARLTALFDRLRDRPDFYRIVGDFLAHAIRLGERFEWPAPGPLPSGCGFSCSKCGFALVVLVGGGAAGIIAGCNPVSTGATGGASCVAALAGVGGATWNAIEACRGCDQCLHPPNPDQPDPGGGGSGCEDPSGCCPKDYHECCNNQCCSDLNPPPICP